MRRNVSPTFALVVILFTLVVGGLYFLYRYRANEAFLARQRQHLTALREEGMRSGRMAQQEDTRAARRAARTTANEKAGPAPGSPQTGGAHDQTKTVGR